jgi:outer membrane protein TolC
MSARFVIMFTLLLRLPLASGAEPWTFERALQHAALHNPDARMAKHRIAAAQAQLAQANSTFWPRLELQSSYTRTDNPMMAFGSILNQRSYRSSFDFNDVPDIDDINVRGVVTAPLYAGGRNTAERRAAKSNARAAKFEEMAIHNEVQFEAARAFLTILKAREFVRAAEGSVRSLEENLLVARRRFDAGAMLKADLLDVEVRLAQAREELVRARNSSMLAERALRNLLGLENADEFLVSDALPPMIIPDSGGEERPELIALRQREEATLAQIRVAHSGYKPRLSAFGNVDYNYGTVTGNDGQSYAVGVIAQWDIWDGFSTRAKVTEAEAKLAMVREELRKVQLAIDFEVEQAQRDFAAATERLTAMEKATAQASESHGLTRNRFEQGSALSSQLLDAESALLNARVRHAEAVSDQRIALAALRKALALPQTEANRAR